MNESTSLVKDFLLGKSVIHKTLGYGVISGIKEDIVCVLFNKYEKEFKRSAFSEYFDLDVDDKMEALRIETAIINDRLLPKNILETLSKYLPLIEHSSVLVYKETSFGEFSVELIDFPPGLKMTIPLINVGRLTFLNQQDVAQFGLCLLYQQSDSLDDYLEENYDACAIADLLQALADLVQIYNSNMKAQVFTSKLCSHSERQMEIEEIALIKELIDSADLRIAPDEQFGFSIFASIMCPEELSKLEQFIALFMQQSEYLFTNITQSSRRLSTSNQIEKPEINPPVVQITHAELIIVSERKKCIREDHELLAISVVIKVLTKGGNAIDLTGPAFYCENCNEYYMLDYDINNMRKKGVLMCRLITESVYNKNRNSVLSSLAPESVLRQHGYCVSKEENLTTSQRWIILDSIIDHHIIHLQKVRSHIAWLIKTRQNMPNMEDAIDKWAIDLKHLDNTYHYNGTRKIGISTIRERQYIEY